MRYDVIVIGAGVMGAATARALAAKGSNVLIAERFRPGHTRGSSHGLARIFRYSYPDPRFVAMAMEALPLWREMERESGRQLISTTGGLDGGKHLDEHERALAANGAAFEMLDATEVRMRWPALSLPEGQTFLFQPDGAVISASEALAASIDGATSRGATLLEDTRVMEIEDTDDRVEVVFDGGDRAEADTVVVTAGPWAGPLLAAAGIHLDVRPTRETVAYFRFDPPVPTIVDWEDPCVYSLPHGSGELKVGEHIAGPLADPDGHDRDLIDAACLERLTEWARERFPEAAPGPHHAETCFYTNTPDGSFVLERHGRVVVGSACSGHGFKFAPLIGRKLAELATA